MPAENGAHRQAQINASKRYRHSVKYLSDRHLRLLGFSLMPSSGGQRCPYCDADGPVIQRAMAGLLCPCCECDQIDVQDSGGTPFDPIRSLTVVVACQACARTWHLFVDLTLWTAAIAMVPREPEGEPVA